MRRSSFTLVEMLVVIVIIAIIAAVAWPGYVAIKEKSLDKEAKAILLLIRVAEKSYRMENGFYYPSSTSTNVIADINNYLRLRLPTSGTRSWVINLDCTAAPEFATVTRSGTGSDGRQWTINLSGDTDTCSGGAACP